MLRRLKRIFLGVFFFLGTAVFAQKTASYTSGYGNFQHGLKLFTQNQYSAAQRIFDRVNKRTSKENLKAETAYYSAISAAHLDQSDAEKQMETFVNNYPESSKRNSAYSDVANLHFKNGDYAEARKWFKKVNRDGLSKSEKKEYYFKNGYAAFKTGDKSKAETYLDRVKNDPEYGSKANYYLGYLAYSGDDYKKARDLFEDVEERDREDKNVSYFQSNISFKSGDFEKAITQGKDQLSRSNTRTEESELNKIIGESYFNLENYEEAIPHLEKYEGKHGRWDNTDYYQLGYAYYKKGDYEKAISQFNKIIDGKDEVAQNAYYHLAQSYIQLDKKQEALNAFKNVSEMDFNDKIKEDASLNYAKLSYDIGNNYKSTPEVLTAFLEHYPDSPERSKIRELLVDSYLTSKNYKKAMELLEESSSFTDKKVFQEVAFYRGLELYSDNKYEKAKSVFDKSLAQHKDQALTARATYWKAESDYSLQNFKDALIGYKEFKGMSAAKKTPEFDDVDYNIGYAYFNTKEYKGAITHFKTYSGENGIDAKQKNDAYLRLGDSYFATKDYWEAMEAYNEAIAQKNVDSDYAYFQKAISYGFVDKNDRKIEDLKDFLANYPESIYRDDALYELGNTYVAEDQPEKGINAYEKLVTHLPKSPYVSRALLKQGLVYYNNDQNEKALDKLKKVAADYENSDEANQAVKTARNIYIDLGKTDEYAEWVESLDYADVSDSDVDDATYESADKKFVDNKTDEAITGFKKYLDEFSNGLHALPAHFHLAQLLYKKDKPEDAEPHYKYVIDQSGNEYTERALEHLSRIYLDNSNYEKASPILKRLEDEANLRNNKTFAQSNLMKAYYKQEDYDKTVDYAEKVLDNDKAEKDAKSDAQIFIARAAMKTGDEGKAKKAYEKVAEMAHGKLAAEAQYYDAYFKRQAGSYEASNESAQVLAKEFSGYKEYSVKGLLLMAKNFYDLDDAYQATYILETIIDNFSGYPETVEKAKDELEHIKSEEAKTNASIKDSAGTDKDTKSVIDSLNNAGESDENNDYE